ncbi:hypothetical protein BBK36DRAFT_1117520, partial [Trichoderma citrinoviride]
LLYILSACSVVSAQNPVLFDSYTNGRCAGGIVVGTTVVQPGDCISSTTAFASAQYRGSQFDNVQQPVVFYSEEDCANEIQGVVAELGDGYNCFTFNNGQAKSAKWIA